VYLITFCQLHEKKTALLFALFSDLLHACFNHLLERERLMSLTSL